jgi:hypothetical protein
MIPSMSQNQARVRTAGAFLFTTLVLVVGMWWYASQTADVAVEHGRGLYSLPLLPAVSDDGPRFQALRSEQSGIAFENYLRPQNLLPYVYNGSGVAIGDYDRDGWPDVYLVSLDGPNKLYRGVGRCQFEDVTASKGVDGGDAWGTGACFVDVDNDQDLDLFVANLESPCLLYRNDGEGNFEEVARELGLDHVGATFMGAFADYDLDGDLDAYLLTNRVLGGTIPRDLLKDVLLPSRVRKSVEQLADPLLIELHGKQFFGGQPDLLLRNDGGRFTDVTKEAGISDQGMGLSATWWDYDQDGDPDLYVANDLESPDALRRNDRGRFVDVTRAALPHVAYFGMGADAADVDNDGDLDFLVADMASTTHFKAKWLMGEMSSRGWFLEHARPQQYMRNALFVNSGTGRFQEAAFLAGVAATDWTWTVKFGDLDGDGRSDLFVTNGVPRFDMNPDLNPRFLELQRLGRHQEAMDLARNVPPFPERNLAYRNTEWMQFQNVAKEWGLDFEGVSHGAAFGDLDRDGDLDLVVNNLHAPASVYRNVGRARSRILVRLEGTQSNRFGVDSQVTVTAGGVVQTKLLTIARGYLASDDPVLHFGLGEAGRIDELSVRWPSGVVQRWRDLPVDRFYTAREQGEPRAAMTASAPSPDPTATPKTMTPQFASVGGALGLDYRHREKEFDDFRRQPLLPHRLSRMGPGIACGDTNGDGHDDVFVGNALFVRDGERFTRRPGPWEEEATDDDLGVLWFDADGDRDLDLLVVTGGVEHDAGDPALRDRLYWNDGAGGFQRAADGVLPDLRESGTSACAADWDRDGDLDLVVCGFSIPGRYPHSDGCRLLRNDGGRFSDATEAVAPALRKVGLATGCCASDYDDDGEMDLWLARHWGPPVLLRNDGGRLSDASAEAGLAEYGGWWNGIATGDLDGDGDFDVVATNFGWNTKYKADAKHPASLFAKDFDQSGSLDVIEAKYQGDELLPVRGRSCSSNAMPFVADKFTTFEAFARANLQEIYGDRGLQQADRLEARTLGHAWFKNDGGRFTRVDLPREAQIAPAFGVAVVDIEGDGDQDVLLAHNFFSPEPETGRMAGGLGLWLRNRGDGTLEAVEPKDSGIVIPDDAKGLACADVTGDGAPDLLVACNDGSLHVLRNTAAQVARLRLVSGKAGAAGARVTLVRADGRKQVLEAQAGSGYLSQSGAGLWFGRAAAAPVELQVRWPDGETQTEALRSFPGDWTVTRNQLTR